VETTCDEMTTTPIPRSPMQHGEGRDRKLGSKVKPRKKGGVGGRCFKFRFCFSLPYSDFIGNKLN